jgi:hypothetical protein
VEVHILRRDDFGPAHNLVHDVQNRENREIDVRDDEIGHVPLALDEDRPTVEEDDYDAP